MTEQESKMAAGSDLEKASIYLMLNASVEEVYKWVQEEKSRANGKKLRQIKSLRHQ